MKKILSFLIALLATFPLHAADGNVFTATIDGGISMTFKVLSESLKTVQVGDGSWASIPISTTGVTIPSTIKNNGTSYNVTSIGSYAFQVCRNLTSLEIPSSVTCIEHSAFFRCSGLTSITIPSSVTKIGYYAFEDCSGLISITIPSSVTGIESSTFQGCTGLTSITIPSSVTSIGGSAFQGCSGLTSITIPSSVTSIGSSSFSNCSGLTSIVVEDENSVYDSRNNCNAIIETNTNTLVAGCKNTVIPKTVTTIGRTAFYGCSNLTSVTLHSSITGIYGYAFGNCTGLQTIYSHIKEPQKLYHGGYGSNGGTIFNNVDYDNCKLYVPKGTKALYKATKPWSYFSNIIELEEGDVNCDGNVTAADVTEVYNHLLNNDQTYINTVDVNYDGVVTAADITALYDILLSN